MEEVYTGLQVRSFLDTLPPMITPIRHTLALFLFVFMVMVVPAAIAQDEVLDTSLEEIEREHSELVVEELEEVEEDLAPEEVESRRQEGYDALERRLLDEAFERRKDTDIPVNIHPGVIDDDKFLVQPGSFFEAGDPGETIVRKITILNKTGEDMIFQISVRDLGVDPEKGTPRFHQPHDVGPYPAKDWIKAEESEIALRHGEMATIPITVTIPEQADVGDHQATIMVRKKRLVERASGGIRVNAYTAIIFVVTVKGDVETGGEFVLFEPLKFFNWKLPVLFTAKAKNTGTVHINPNGNVKIKNLFGAVVDDVPFPSWHVMRGTAYTKQFDWRPKYAFGYYTAIANLEFAVKDGDPIPVDALSTSFVILPLIPTLVLILAIFAVSFLVQVFFTRFELRRK